MSRFCPTLGQAWCRRDPSGFSVPSQREKKKKKRQRERERIKKEADQKLFCSLQEKALRKLLFKVHFRFQNSIFHATGFGLVLFAAFLSEVERTEHDKNYLFRVAFMKKRPLHHPYSSFIFP